jgi:hypothetical protein
MRSGVSKRNESARITGAVWMAGVVTVLVVLVCVANAQAGTYAIDNCPSAPGGNGNPGSWTVFESPQAGQGDCAGPVGSYIGPLGGEMGPNHVAGVQIAVPARSGITIRAARIWLAIPADIAGATVYGIASTNVETVWQAYASVNNGSTPLELQLPSTTTELTLANYCANDDKGAGCTFGGGENPILQLFGAQLTLEDNSLPTGSVTGGGLSGSGMVTGTQALTYTASDPNSGVRAVDLLVDDKQVAQNDYGAHCPYQNFLACPATVSDSIGWNTATVSAGAYEVALKVVSAAGDTAIIDDHVVTVDNGSGPPSASPVTSAATQICAGSGASGQAKLTARWSRTAKMTLTGRYGAWEHVSGRLTTPSGQAIAGATIDVCETPAYEGARTSTIVSTHTGPTGAWSIMLPQSTSSAVLRFAYPSPANGTVPLATAILKLRVHAGIALGITPRVTSMGRRIFFSGVVHGTPIPPGGKQLVLEASSGGEWIQFDTIHTNARGLYHASYRFKLPGPVSYRFRVLSPHEADFPYLSGMSNSVVVHEL